MKMTQIARASCAKKQRLSIFFAAMISLICGFSFADSAISIESKALPLIKNPNAKDSVFKQFTKDAQANLKSIRRDPDTAQLNYSFYKVIVPDNFDFLWLGARFTPISEDTISTINSISSASADIRGKTLIIPTVSGIFLSAEPETAWESLLYKKYDSSLGSELENYAKFLIDGKLYYFLRDEKFDSTARLYFLDVTMHTPLKQGIMTSAYGYRVSPISGQWKFHAGLDLAAPEGSDVFSCLPGKITVAEYNSVYGNYISITHYNGYSSLYAHLSAILVKVGDKVDGGEIIGKVGTTGASTGPHLHFEVRKNGKTENPETLIKLP